MVQPLDRNSWQPLYSQISEQVRHRIENELSPGDQLPSENELMSRYGVSRNTVRLAIDTLINQGLAQRVRGKGTFVSPQRWQYGLYRLVSFTEETRRRGMRPSSHLLNLTRLVPPVKITQALRLQPDQEVFLVERLRLADQTTMALNVSYLPCNLCPDLDKADLTSGSIYEVIETQYHLQIGYAQQTLKPTIASKSDAAQLHIRPGSPLLLVEGVAYLTDGTPVEYARLLYRGDRYEFPIQAVRQPNFQPNLQEHPA